jgi:hypothetical protein
MLLPYLVIQPRLFSSFAVFMLASLRKWDSENEQICV